MPNVRHATIRVGPANVALFPALDADSRGLISPDCTDLPSFGLLRSTRAGYQYTFADTFAGLTETIAGS
jgi:hypothetical protein